MPSEKLETDIARAAKTLRQLISPVAIGRDELVRLTGLPTFVVLAALTELEIAGHITVVEGGAYVRV